MPTYVYVCSLCVQPFLSCIPWCSLIPRWLLHLWLHLQMITVIKHLYSSKSMHKAGIYTFFYRKCFAGLHLQLHLNSNSASHMCHIFIAPKCESKCILHCWVCICQMILAQHCTNLWHSAIIKQGRCYSAVSVCFICNDKW